MPYKKSIKVVMTTIMLLLPYSFAIAGGIPEIDRPEKIAATEKQNAIEPITIEPIVKEPIIKKAAEEEQIVTAPTVTKTAKEEPLVAEEKVAAKMPELPFAVGEKLVFNASWFVFDAGRITATVEKAVTEGGNRMLQISLHTETTNVMADIWTMDDMFTSYWDVDARASRRLEVKIRESTVTKDKLVLFDIENNKATVQKDKDKPEEFALDKGAQDFITAGYYSRLLPLVTGKKYEYPVFEDNKNYKAKIKVLKRETIEVLGQKVKAILLMPKIKFEGAFQSRGQLYVWLSDDKYRVPVQLKLKTFFGTVLLSLTEYQGRNKLLNRKPE